MNLPRSPTSANFHQDIILHIQVVHQLQVKLMHSLIREWFLNSSQPLENTGFVAGELSLIISLVLYRPISVYAL